MHTVNSSLAYCLYQVLVVVRILISVEAKLCLILHTCLYQPNSITAEWLTSFVIYTKLTVLILTVLPHSGFSTFGEPYMEKIRLCKSLFTAINHQY